MRCGHLLAVRSCGDCGEDRPGSGNYGHLVTRSCKTRACVTCGWVRARNTSEFMAKAFDAIEEVDGYRWQFVTLTTRYNPHDPEDLTAAALRGRAMLAMKIARGAWAKMLKVKGAGMLRTVEVGIHGHVHAHLVYYGPKVDKDRLDVVTEAVDCRAGFTDVRALDSDPVEGKPGEREVTDDPRGSKTAVKRAARYASKGMGHKKEHASNEGWFAGDQTAVMMDEVLAARWEVGVYRLQLSQRYGSLRGLEFDEDADIEPETDDHVSCEACGVVGGWRTSVRHAESWLQYCHDKGSPGLEGSRWKPAALGGSDYCR